jgi:hypothetical protein
MDDFSHRMTPFDAYISNQSLQMMKLMVPFLPPSSQRILAVMIKFLELQHTLSYFRGMKQKSNATEGILDAIKPFMSPSDTETFDQMMNMMSMMTMMQEMQENDFDPMSMMAGVFAQDDHTEPQKEGESHD